MSPTQTGINLTGVVEKFTTQDQEHAGQNKKCCKILYIFLPNSSKLHLSAMQNFESRLFPV